MARDLRLIRELEEMWRHTLLPMELRLISGVGTGYIVDDNKNVIGLNLNNMGLSDIDILSEFKNLKYLKASKNFINNISVFEKLPHITFLDLSENRLTYIHSLSSLRMLTHLDISHNSVSEIEPLLFLEHLSFLDLSFNSITRLPPKILNFNMEIGWEKRSTRWVTGMFLEGNFLESPPMEIVMKGKTAVKGYFNSLVGEEKALNEVKMILVGDGGAGKTSLVKRLLNEGFAMDENQTHGIDIRHCRIKKNEDKITVNIWDFGGQEIMHATHQFFLSRRSLYLLVLDGRKDEKTEYWLKMIQSFGGDSPVLIVINKIDQNPSCDVNRKFLVEKYPNIKGFFRISCRTTVGMKEFFFHLVEELARVELIQSTWGVSWFNVKRKLEVMKRDYISYSEYKTLCEREQVLGSSSQEVLVDYLHDLGIVLHFKEFELQDTHVLNPLWVTTGVYKIINSNELFNGKGLLEIESFQSILGSTDNVESRYPVDKYSYLIHLMEKFELCFKIENHSILIPDLLQIQEPAFEFDYSTALKFQVKYDYLPRSIIPRFIVRMHHDIMNRLCWRTGVILENNAFGTTAVIKSDAREKTIFFYVNGTRKRNYFVVLLHTLRQINKSFNKMDFSERVPLPDNPSITVGYEHLLWLEDSGIQHYAPDGARKNYNISELLGTIQKDTYKELLKELKKEFLLVKKKREQKRGFAFEKFLTRLFQVADLSPRSSFRSVGEQIDGSFQMENTTYLVEAKWTKKKTALQDLLVFDGKVSGKAKWTRGFFISIAGFSDEGKAAFAKGRNASFVALDGNDLEFLLDNDISLADVISWKSRHAAETNDFFVSLPVLFKKIKMNG